MASESPIFCVPHNDPGQRLVGRDAPLEQLHARLSAADAPTLLTALQGTGGIGKTQLAARYCYAKKLDYPGGIVWLSMADPKRTTAELAGWAEKLVLNVTDPSDRAKAQAVIGKVISRRDALLVLDNLDDPALLDRDLPDLPNTRPRGFSCRLLVTSRLELPECRTVRLDFLPSPADRALLLREAGRQPPSGVEAAALADLLGMLGGLPLALVMIGRFLASNVELSFVALRDALRRAGAVAVLDKRGQIPGDYKDKVGRSFQALLSEIWDRQSDADRRTLKALALLGENAFVPDAAVPLLIDLPPPDADGLGPAPLAQALARLDAAPDRTQSGAGSASPASAHSRVRPRPLRKRVWPRTRGARRRSSVRGRGAAWHAR